MLVRKPVGRQAAALKYDFLTALGAHALAQSKGPQRLVLRLMTLITARYNWAHDELAVGQREIARLWGVDERTVKREMAKLRAMGWLVVKRQGARGRVTEHGLDIVKILEATKPVWAAVGPDFEARMGAGAGDGPNANVVPLPVKTDQAGPPPDVSCGTEWALTQAIFHAEDPGTYRAWVQGLERGERAGGRLTLIAPSRFHASYVATHLKDRLLNACKSVDGDVTELILHS